MDNTILMTGATGYLGGLAAAALAADRSARLILLVRGKHEPASVAARIAAEADFARAPGPAGHFDRIIVVPMSDVFTVAAVVRAVRQYPISEIVHCAGSLSYWNAEKLRAGNGLLTEELLSVGQRLGVRRFIYLSTAFSSGYINGVVGEQLHRSHGIDPTPYTSSKREAEMMVATSGLPYVILRPSIVIGDSRDGRYTGKLSGLYQFLWAAQRYLSGRPCVIHAVAPEIPLHVVHQDAFQAGFLGAYKHLPDDSVIHLVSREGTLPTVRQLWEALVARYLPECESRYYDHFADIPMEECDSNMRQFLSAVRTNAEICSHRWCFESRSMKLLRNMGTGFADASFRSITMCQDRFLGVRQPAAAAAPPVTGRSAKLNLRR